MDLDQVDKPSADGMLNPQENAVSLCLSRDMRRAVACPLLLESVPDRPRESGGSFNSFGISMWFRDQNIHIYEDGGFVCIFVPMSLSAILLE
jgi:hypothetical protein